MKPLYLKFQIHYFNPEIKDFQACGKYETIGKLAKECDISYNEAYKVYKGRNKTLCKFIKITLLPKPDNLKKQDRLELKKKIRDKWISLGLYKNIQQISDKLDKSYYETNKIYKNGDPNKKYKIIDIEDTDSDSEDE